MAASLTEVLSTMQQTNIILSKIQQTLAGAGTTGSVPRSYLAGAITANNAGTPNTKIDLTAGVMADSGNAVLINLAAPVTIDLTTTGVNGVDVGTIAASKSYQVFVISQAGNINAASIVSLSLTPALPTGYSYYRRVGTALTTAGSVLIAYTQVGDEFFLTTPITDVSAGAPGAAAVTRTLSTPGLIVTEAIVRVACTNPGAVGQDGVLLSPLFATDVAPANAAQCTAGSSAGVGVNSVAQARCLTNTASQIRSRMVSGAAGGGTTIITEGWRDFLGRYS